ncbi:glycosyltransferase [Veillonella sp. DNF00869]|uniref:glycosyltransferase n=1 Tax=Veillonella sp. DNF00869 TaxID=1384081 RepID=UPI000785F971|nr:glycosyltransferase [Veillonella sp. DNF00869]KXB88157.1 hypothetical protein HMPREF3032_00809 [Veillonella sp. DNF00869]
MRVAILESIVMPAGHEVEFDRILVEELKKQGHEPVFFVPENFPFKVDYGVDVEYLEGGEAISYAGVSRWKRMWLSLLREKRRKAWFNSAYKKILDGKCDALIIPTASFRFARSIIRTQLKHSPVPIIMLFHGIMEKERSRFELQAKQCEPYENIHLKVLTFRDEYNDGNKKNISSVVPPVYTPKEGVVRTSSNELLTIGFFGQFRKEKQLNQFLDAFIEAKFDCPVNLLVQGATVTPTDAELFESMMKEYSAYDNIRFLHKNLIGKEWDDQLINVDALLLPYGAERYRYQCSAILFTAIGFNKPVLVSEEINPEVLENYHIGHTLDLTSKDTIVKGLEEFVHAIHNYPEAFSEGLIAANQKYSGKHLIQQILEG